MNEVVACPETKSGCLSTLRMNGMLVLTPTCPIPPGYRIQCGFSPVGGVVATAHPARRLGEEEGAERRQGRRGGRAGERDASNARLQQRARQLVSSLVEAERGSRHLHQHRVVVREHASARVGVAAVEPDPEPLGRPPHLDASLRGGGAVGGQQERDGARGGAGASRGGLGKASPCVPSVWCSPSRLRANSRGISSCGAPHIFPYLPISRVAEPARCTGSVHTEQLGVAAAIADRRAVSGRKSSAGSSVVTRAWMAKPLIATSSCDSPISCSFCPAAILICDDGPGQARAAAARAAAGEGSSGGDGEGGRRRRGRRRGRRWARRQRPATGQGRRR